MRGEEWGVGRDGDQGEDGKVRRDGSKKEGEQVGGGLGGV